MGAAVAAIGCLPAARFITTRLMGTISAAAAAAAAPARRDECGFCMEGVGNGKGGGEGGGVVVVVAAFRRLRNAPI